MTDTLDFSQMNHHPVLEELTDMLVATVGQSDRHFFRTLLVHYFAKMAASMKARVVTETSLEDIPVNVFATVLAESGFGKGHTTSIIENHLIKSFELRFKNDTFPVVSENSLWKLAIENAVTSGETEEKEKEKLDKEFESFGPIPFTFDSGTTSGVKNTRNKLLMGGIGSINLQVDEIGQNLIASLPLLNLFFELYDHGRAKMKLINNSADNKRSIEYEGKTPTNALMFGTQVAIYDSGPVEQAFMALMEQGYARRCIFAWGVKDKEDEILTGKERYQRLKNQVSKGKHTAYSNIFANLADIAKYEWEMTVPDDVMVLFLDYQAHNEKIAAGFKEADATRRHELTHRDSKAMKIAGAFAFIDESQEITMLHAQAAIKFVEDSGATFLKFLNREKPYVRLARHLAECETEQTDPDLDAALSFYPNSSPKRQELMSFAVAWGHKNNHIIRKSFRDGIWFFSGESLPETNLDEVILSYSDHTAEGYEPVKVPFDQLHKLTSAQGMHWCTHQFVDEYRNIENAIPEFNLAVFDVDGTASLEFVNDVLKDYTFMTATTKRHTDEHHRFRLVMPLSHHLKLDLEDYREFMEHFTLWLPFEVDIQASKDIARKWRTHGLSQHAYNHAELLSPLPFIPKTAKNEQYNNEVKELRSLDNLERWFAQRMENGTRNNEMIKYTLALVSSGMSFIELESRVINFNNQLPNGLSSDELRNTVLKTAAKKIHENAAA